MPEKQIQALLREEFARLRRQVDFLNQKIVQIEISVAASADLRRNVREHQKELELRAVRLTMSESHIAKLQKDVVTLEHSLQNLLLSRAALVGYVTAAATVAAGVVQLLMEWKVY